MRDTAIGCRRAPESAVAYQLFPILSTRTCTAGFGRQPVADEAEQVVALFGFDLTLFKRDNRSCVSSQARQPHGIARSIDNHGALQHHDRKNKIREVKMSKWTLQTNDPTMPEVSRLTPCDSLREAVVQAIKARWSGEDVVGISCPDGKTMGPVDIVRWRLDDRGTSSS
jgi:hypothetical protein